jgi:hypothetical protein
MTERNFGITSHEVDILRRLRVSWSPAAAARREAGVAGVDCEALGKPHLRIETNAASAVSTSWSSLRSGGLNGVIPLIVRRDREYLDDADGDRGCRISRFFLRTWDVNTSRIRRELSQGLAFSSWRAAERGLAASNSRLMSHEFGVHRLAGRTKDHVHRSGADS